MSDFKAAASQVVITAPIGFPLAGTRVERISNGNKDDLYAKVLIIQQRKEIVVFVSCDALAISRQTVLNVRKLVDERLGISGRNILIGATHTHTGPATVPIFKTEPDSAYMEVLEKKIVGAIESAFVKLTPAIIKQGKGKETDITYNRRVLLKDGTMIIGGLEDETKVEDIEEVEGIIDSDVGVLVIEDMNGKIISILYNFACHSDIVTGTEYSADYPYYVQQTVNSILETKDVPVIMLTGACGNINHLNVYDPKGIASRSRYFDKYGLKRCKKFSNILASEIVKTALKAKKLQNQEINITNKIMKVALRKPTQEELQWSKDILGAVEREEKEETSANEIIRLKKLQETVGFVDMETQVINIGEVAVVTIPCEVFTEIGLKIKEISPYDNTFVSTLTNGYEGYMPTKKAFENGGYEAKSAFSSKLSRDAGEIVVKYISDIFNGK